MSAVVLIPCFKPDLSPVEALSLRQCRAVLGRRDLRVVMPEGLALPPEFAGLEPEVFPPGYFKSTGTYSRLTLSLEFHDRFSGFEHMLIHQLDAYVFRDELDFWCTQTFDYVGAPWGGGSFPKKRMASRLPWVWRFPWLARITHGRDFRVGNGGFSLRRLPACRRVLLEHPQAVASWKFNSDLFWSFEAPALDRAFRIAPEKQAMRFSLETQPRAYLERMHGELPFGCHAWRRYDPACWRPFIPEPEAP